MTTIKNMQQLVKNGMNPDDRKARELVLKSLTSALNAVDPREIIRARVVLEGHTLKVDPYAFDLKKFKHIYVIGGGKASGSMAEALEQVLNGHITNGLVNVLHGTKNKTKIVKLQGASHPVPDEAGVEGTRKMLQIAEKRRRGRSDHLSDLRRRFKPYALASGQHQTRGQENDHRCPAEERRDDKRIQHRSQAHFRFQGRVACQESLSRQRSLI